MREILTATDETCRTLQKADWPHFVTFNTWKRWILPDRARDEVMSVSLPFSQWLEISLVCSCGDARTCAAILVPERNETGDPLPLSDVLHSIKSYTANRIQRLTSVRGHIWQDETLDHVIRKEESLESTIEYLRMNPVRRGLVSGPEDYGWLWIKRFDQ